MKKFLFDLLIIASLLVASAKADLISLWNFNSVPSDGSKSTGTNVPSSGYGVASLIGGVTATFSEGSTNDPASQTDDSGWNTSDYPSQGLSNKTAGVQFNVSTLGYSNIVVRWDHRVSGTASRYFRFQYSANGTAFTDAAAPIVMLSSQSSPSSYYEAKTNSLSAITAVNNNANFAFRMVSEFESTAAGSGTNGYVTVTGSDYSASSGNVRFDYVTITGTPIPGANTPPSISTISNQTVRVNHTTGALPFTIADAQDPATSLALNKTSSDPAVIPTSSIVFGGSGTNRSVTISAGNQTGASTITIWVIDTGGRSNSMSFSVTVLPLNTVPVISSISPAYTIINTPAGPIDFTIGDLETPAGSLTLSPSSANTALVPNANIVFGGSDSNRTVTVTPANGQIGVAPITVNVSDGTNIAGSTFPVMITPSADVVFYDPFAYGNGSLLTNSAFLWGNRSGTFGQCQVTNEQLLIVGATGEDVIGDLVGGPYAKNEGTLLYASFKVKFVSLPKSTPGYFAHFVGGSSLRGRVSAGTTNALAGTFRLHVANGSDDTTEFVANLSTNVTYLVVTRYDIDSATTRLWINPGSESDTSVTASDAATAVSIGSYAFRQDSTLGAAVLIDDLRVGKSFGSVMGILPIPLSVRRVGNQIVLTWSSSAFGLQAAPSVGGPYTNVPSATSPYTNTIGGQGRFFRLRSN